MLISHEVPRTLLAESLIFNDYDYFLIHLYEKYEEYRQFYQVCKNLNRRIILDNSACELRGKEEFDFDKFANYVKELEPTEYLIPDVFNDYDKNLNYFDNWIVDYGDLPGKMIATIHGSTEQEMIEAYKYFKHFNVKIAINFDECVYTQYSFSENVSLNKMLNRLHFIHKLVYSGIIDENREHHILGCHLPQEFSSYKRFKWISTIDTSNPVMAAYDQILYGNEGLLSKPKSNIDTTQNIDLTNEIKYNVLYNVKQFRKICEE